MRKTLRFLAVVVVIVSCATALARDLVWVRAEGKHWELVDQPGHFVKLWSDVEQSSMAYEIKPKKSQQGRVYLVLGDRKGSDVWKAEILGRLMQE